MDASAGKPMRILVVARPAVSREIEAALRASGHEVHRTPDPAAVATLAARLRPQAGVVALDLPWGDAMAAAHDLRDGLRPIPVLLLGAGGTAAPPDDFPRLPPTAGAAALREAIAELTSHP